MIQTKSQQVGCLLRLEPNAQAQVQHTDSPESVSHNYSSIPNFLRCLPTSKYVDIHQSINVDQVNSMHIHVFCYNGSNSCVCVFCRCTVWLCAAARTLCPGVYASCWLNSSRVQTSTMTSTPTIPTSDFSLQPSCHTFPPPSNKNLWVKKIVTYIRENVATASSSGNIIVILLVPYSDSSSS